MQQAAADGSGDVYSWVGANTPTTDGAWVQIGADYTRPEGFSALTLYIEAEGTTPLRVRVAGRMGPPRVMGKAAFFHLADEGGRIQVYVRQEDMGPEAYDDIFRHLLDAGDWLGVGPGAHGRLTLGGERWSTEAVRLPEAWLRQVETLGHGEKPRRALDAADRLAELLLMGLRLAEGVPTARIEAAAGLPLAEALDGAALRRFTDAGLLDPSTDRLAATAAGRQRLSAILASLLR